MVTLDWTHPLREIGEKGLVRERASTLAELTTLASALGILEVSRLNARYEIRPCKGGLYILSGDLAADVVQECVVTLVPVPEKIEEKFEVEFWPRRSMPSPPSGDIELLSSRDVESIDGNIIDAGRIVFETLAAALDPYPRAAGAAFEWFDPVESGKTTSPFAGLEALKPKE